MEERRNANSALRRQTVRQAGVQHAPLKEREGYETVFDDASMTVLVVPGREDEAIVSFTGVGHMLGAIDLQNPEFARSEGDQTKIFVIDKKRSWGNSIDWDRLTSIVSGVSPRAEITTLGNSMGGFLAILSAPMLGARRAIAFVPQWSIDPAIVHRERRWMEYRRKIREIRYPDLSEAVASANKVYVFFGMGLSDRFHARYFKRTKAEMYFLDNCAHDVAKHLKRVGLLYPVISACCEGGDVKALLAEAKLRSGTS